METYWSRFSEEFNAKQDYTAGRKVIDIVIEKLSKKRSLGNVLELGCGNGRYTQSIVEHAQTVTATDYSTEMVNAAKHLLENFKNVTVAQADCHQTSYDSQTFDTVLMANLIHVIDQPEVAIREVKRLLKPGGQLLVTSFATEGMSILNKLTLLYRFRRTFGAFPKGGTMFTRNSLCHLLEEEGFMIDSADLFTARTSAVYIEASLKPAKS